MHDDHHDHPHDHSHPHDHEHSPEHEHPHVHEHTHPHDHTPPHCHEHHEGSNHDRTKTLLTYMLDHNREHTQELSDMAHTLHHAGFAEAAGLLDAGVKDFESGNEKLAKVLGLI